MRDGIERAEATIAALDAARYVPLTADPDDVQSRPTGSYGAGAAAGHGTRAPRHDAGTPLRAGRRGADSVDSFVRGP